MTDQSEVQRQIEANRRAVREETDRLIKEAARERADRAARERAAEWK